MHYRSTGIIQYDPNRLGMKNRVDWWAVLDVDREITRYYRWWIQKRYWIELIKPSWDAHVSIVRGEEPADNLKYLWKKYDKQKVEFSYSHNVYKGKKQNFWMVEVDAPKLIEIRKELKLPTNWKLHLTVGKSKY